MKNSIVITLFSMIVIIGCTPNDVNPSSKISAQVNWTADVSSVNLTNVGVSSGEVLAGQVYELQNGKGTITWMSDGIAYSRTVDVGGVDATEDDDIECEQEGEHEGDNEGCLVQFSFSGARLNIN